MGHKFYNNPGATPKFHEPYMKEFRIRNTNIRRHRIRFVHPYAYHMYMDRRVMSLQEGKMK
jgi:hypothetical protein